jgi:hypothetical protein
MRRYLQTTYLVKIFKRGKRPQDLTSLAIRETQIKTTMRYHYTSTRMVKIKIVTDNLK